VTGARVTVVGDEVCAWEGAPVSSSVGQGVGGGDTVVGRLVFLCVGRFVGRSAGARVTGEDVVAAEGSLVGAFETGLSVLGVRGVGVPSDGLVVGAWVTFVGYLVG